ncbi:tRNA (adenosine(37)-N6)-threonylcarbamoyltransferase complex ATPase subunit type 1 TsaE [Roseibium sp.]|uniref:tRNA (adenosine(37)-N6)-threonylcarbamoyltransferase complex ATPase subunit type 1 TsaE n=1 Tax=Roseibium sp. TaxID=1936156 RepID=UPI003A9797A0
MSEALLRDVENPDFIISLANEAATVALAEDLAACLAPGDLICLSGDLGAGKSTLVRALLRAFADDDELEVPSPTFTLVQSYELPRFAISHFDLYRLEEPEEVQELGLDELLESGAALVEWPEMGEGELPRNRIWISLQGGDDDKRVASIKLEGELTPHRMTRSFAIRAFLTASGHANALRRYLKGDASARAYELIRIEGQDMILMNAPALETLENGEALAAYARSAHLALDIRSFVAVDQELRRQGFAAPEIFASDLQQGLLLQEHLGSEGVLDAAGNVLPERYHVATDVLAQMHRRTWPRILPLPGGESYVLPDFSREALLAEVCLFLDWYVPEVSGSAASDALRQEFRTLWSAVFDKVGDAELGWVLRDYHSPNLHWRGERSGHARVGLIDFQDAMIGPTAYDLGSLLFDARVDVPEVLEQELLSTYLKVRQSLVEAFDQTAFRAAYSVYAAQRITKILGIFVRLAKRDGKSAYLSHLPRMNAYLDRALRDPVLSDLKHWFDLHRPR